MGADRQPIAIAVVDDDVVDRMLAIRAFAAAGLVNQVIELGDGEALLDLVYRRGPFRDKPEPGLVLLDLVMPRLDGKATLARVRADPRHADLPLVILTQSDHPDDIRRSYLAGATSYMGKPVTRAGVVRVVESIPSLEIATIPDKGQAIVQRLPV